MKKELIPLVALAFLLFGVTLSRAGEKKAFVLMIDGLRADALFTGNTPNVDSIRDGTWADGYKSSWSYQAHTNLDSDPSSATNHVAIMTGVTATKNGCYNNGQTEGAKWDEYPSFLSRLRKIDPDLKTAWLYNWGEDKDIRTDADYISPPSGDTEIFDNVVALINGTFPTTDGVDGTRWNAGDDPDVVVAYVDSCDGAGHGHGFSVRVPEYMSVVEDFDKRIGDVLQAIKGRPTFDQEDWLIVVTSDHGGIGHSHGVAGCQNCYTIPLVVSSKSIASGWMVGEPHNCDTAAYVMSHFTGSVPESFDGKVRDVHQDTPSSVKDGLLAYFPFEGDCNPAVGDLKASSGYLLPSFALDGQVGKAISFESPTPLSLGKPQALQFGKDKGFSFAFWFRAKEPQKQDAPIIANKDWDDGQKPGIVICAHVHSDAGTKLEYNLADGTNRIDINPLEYEANGRWYFVAVTADREGSAVLYLGDPEGRLSFVSDLMTQIGDLNGIDWFIGQDGTGNHDSVFTGDLDELMIWSRPIRLQEVSQLYQKGLEGKSVLK